MENTLSHHGIKGQKWGVRRFRNKDGSLTPAGKKRQREGLNNAMDYAKTHARLEDATQILRRSGWDGKSKLLVPSDVKQYYSKLVNEFVLKEALMRKKYKDVFSDVIVDEGKRYVYTLLEDRVTGEGYESKVELSVQ